MKSGIAAQKEIVLVGAGHSHPEILKAIIKKNIRTPHRITLVCDEISIPYFEMVCGYLMGEYKRDDFFIDLRKVCNSAGVRLIHAKVEQVCPEENKIIVEGRPPIRYDSLLVNCGAVSQSHEIQDADRFAVPVKPISSFVNLWPRILQEITAYKITRKITMIGGNATGVEMLIAIRRAILNELQKQSKIDLGLKFRLITAEEEILSGEKPIVQKKMREYLQSKNVEIITGSRVSKMQENKIYLEDGKTADSDTHFLCTGNAPSNFQYSGLDTDENGFLLVDKFLRSTKFENVYVSGEAARVKNYHKCNGGSEAVLQGQYLAKNFSRILKGQKPLLPYIQKKNSLKVLNLGESKGLLCWKWVHYFGYFAHRFKSRPNFKYIDSFQNLPARQNSRSLPHNESIDERKSVFSGRVPDQEILYEVLKELGFSDPGEKKASDFADENAYHYAPKRQGLYLQSSVFLKEFPRDEFLFGRVLVRHAVNSIFSRGGTPVFLSVGLFFPSSRLSLFKNSIFPFLAGISQELNSSKSKLAEVKIVGAENFGASLHVTGQVAKTKLIDKREIQTGQSLVITKPLGTGALRRANVRNEVRAEHFEKGIHSMLLGHADVHEVFSHFDIEACNVVYERGFAQAIFQMLRGSDLLFNLDLKSIPLLDGALESLEADEYATIQKPAPPDFSEILLSEDLQKDPRTRILFDPEISGPLLIAVDASRAKTLVKNLQEMGYLQAAILGEFSKAHQSTPHRIRIT